MTITILNREAFAQMMETSLDGWFHRESVEKHCQDAGIFFDMGHYWDCIWKHRHDGSIEERPSGIVHEFSLWRSPNSAEKVKAEMPEFKFLEINQGLYTCNYDSV
jgi:hypothetical protein